MDTPAAKFRISSRARENLWGGRPVMAIGNSATKRERMTDPETPAQSTQTKRAGMSPDAITKAP